MDIVIITFNEIVSIAPGEGQIPVVVVFYFCLTLEPYWEAFAFRKVYYTGRNHFSKDRKIYITPSKYVKARLKCCHDRCVAIPQNIFHAFDWTEGNAVASSVHFAESFNFNMKSMQVS